MVRTPGEVFLSEAADECRIEPALAFELFCAESFLDKWTQFLTHP